MTVVSATFTGFVFGSPYAPGSASFNANNRNNTTLTGYISDSQSTNALINVGDSVSYNYRGGSVNEIYQGYNINNGSEFPLYTNPG